MANNNSLFDVAVKISSNARKGVDKGIISSNAQSSIIMKDEGTLSMSSGMYAQLKCDKNSGITSEVAIQSFLNAVQREITVNDLIINRHKFNNQLFELTNLKANMGTAMGDIMMQSTILVKAWDSTLEEFVLIRRPAYLHMFGNMLDGYIVDERLDIDENMTEDMAEMLKTLNDFPPEEEQVDEIPEDSITPGTGGGN